MIFASGIRLLTVKTTKNVWHYPHWKLSIWLHQKLVRNCYSWRNSYMSWGCFVRLCKNSPFHTKSKHIDVRYHFLWVCDISRKIGLEKISTTNNFADGMTKCLSIDQFQSLRHQMGIWKNQSHRVKHPRQVSNIRQLAPMTSFWKLQLRCTNSN